MIVDMLLTILSTPRLVKEVGQIQESIGLLNDKLREAQTAHQVWSGHHYHHSCPHQRNHHELSGPSTKQKSIGARPGDQRQLFGNRPGQSLRIVMNILRGKCFYFFDDVVVQREQKDKRQEADKLYLSFQGCVNQRKSFPFKLLK